MPTSSIRLHTLAALSVSLQIGTAQSQWTPVAATGPSARTEVIMPSDQASALLFGGVHGPTQTAFNELWRFDGVGWTLLQPTGPLPSPRSRLAGGYDLIRGKLVLFGGDAQYVGGGALGDTWEYDVATNTWANPLPTTTPTPRVHARMAFDLPRARMVMFGGGSGGSVNNETWAWDGTDWTQLFPAVSPSARQQVSLCYNQDTGELLLFGGSTGAASGLLGDTWAFDGTDWRQLVTATTPGAGIRNAKLTYDPVRQRSVMFGGVTAAGFGNTVWEFDGTDWAANPAAPGPSTRAGMGVEFVPALGTTVVACGYNGSFHADTFTFQTDTLATWSTTGQGCPTSAGDPTLALSAAPWAGDSVQFLIGNLPIAGLPFLILGFSSTTWNGQQLPLDLGLFGFPGCPLLVSLDNSQLALGPITASLPNQPVLYGYSLHAQAAVLEGTSPQTLGVSARLDMTIGAR